METTTGHSRIDYLIDLYLSGKIDKALLVELKNLAAQSEENRNYIRERIEVWFSAGMIDNFTSSDLDDKFESIEQRIEADEQEEGEQSYKFPLKWIVWIAAVVLIILLPLGGYWMGMTSSSKQLANVSMETALGARTQVYLPDSTMVWLNAGSKLTYSSGYGTTDRHVVLQGEALFDVRHNEKLPFEINSKEVDLKVLGTRFVFSNYPDDDCVTVDLVRGKVFLASRSGKGQMYLAPNERMVMNKRTGLMHKQMIDATMSDAWTKGRLFFDETSLTDIAKALSRNYNVKVTVTSSIQNDSFYGSFDMKQNTVEDILRTIASTKQMKYRYKNGEYILY